MSQVGNTIQLDLKRDGDLLFHLFCGVTGPLGNDLDVGVGDVWIGFNGQIVERNDAPNEQDDSETHHQDPIVQRQVNQVTDHLLCVASGSKSSGVASRWGMSFSIAKRAEVEALKRLASVIFRFLG